MKTPAFRVRMAGLTMIELMIALAIGSLLVLGVVGLFATSRQTQETQQHLNRIGEDIRFLSEFMARDIRMAGYANEDCSVAGAALSWSPAEQKLIVRYCENAQSTESVYRFNADEPRVSYVKRDEGDGTTPEGLVEGVVLDGIWFGEETADAKLLYSRNMPANPVSVRTVRLNLAPRGDVAIGAEPEDRALPTFEFTVAVRNNILMAMGDDS